MKNDGNWFYKEPAKIQGRRRKGLWGGCIAARNARARDAGLRRYTKLLTRSTISTPQSGGGGEKKGRNKVSPPSCILVL